MKAGLEPVDRNYCSCEGGLGLKGLVESFEVYENTSTAVLQLYRVRRKREKDSCQEQLLHLLVTLKPKNRSESGIVIVQYDDPGNAVPGTRVK